MSRQIQQIYDKNAQMSKSNGEFKKKQTNYMQKGGKRKQSLMKASEGIQKLNDKVIVEAFNNKEYKYAATLLTQLLALIEEHQSFTNKKNYFYHLYVYQYNQACLNYHLQQSQLTCKQLEKAISNFQIMQAYAKTREENVVYNVQYVKVHLQLCAALSQNGDHKAAIVTAEKCLNKLIESFRILEAICYEYKLLNIEPDTNENSVEGEDGHKSDRVDFRRVVIKEAEKKLADLANLPTTKKILLEDNKHYSVIILNTSKNIYFWKDNEGNNEKNLRRQFDVSKSASPRNILGLQKKQLFAQSFHIGYLMGLKVKTIKSQFNFDTYYLLSPQNILQMVLYTAASYFTIATETRFHQFQEDLDSLTISQKYKRLHDNDTMNKCKLLHIKALQITAKHLPPSNFFFLHLMGSFNKNYKFLLDEIKQQLEVTIGEESNLNINTWNNKELTQYGTKKHIKTQKEGIKKYTRKRSKTNDKLKGKNNSKSKLGL